DRRLERGGGVHDRPHAGDDDPGRDRLHGRLLLRQQHQEHRRRPHPQRPEQRDRGPRRAGGRGHRRQRVDAALSARCAPDAPPGLGGGGRAATQGKAGRHSGRCRSRRVRHPRRVRHRVRTGLCGAIPKPAIRRDPRPRRDQGRSGRQCI
ncbi:MAG: Hypoxanthine-guanine phosphoribosyltransferase, partial [uncultured Thermomicrobiales bacterium]